MMRVVVLGGGVVGVAAAYHLGLDGHRVSLVERSARPGDRDAASHGNAGLLTPGDAWAWASPAALLTFVRSLAGAELGLKVRPRLDPRLWRWSLRFLAQCTSARARRNTLRKLRLALYSRECLHELIERTGVEFSHRRAGVLYFFRSAKHLEQGAARMQLLAEHGLELEVLDRERLVAAEPALAPSRGLLAGGLRSPMDETGDCAAFCRALAAWCVEHQQLRLLTGTTVTALDNDGERVHGVLTDQGRIEADAVVLALGCESGLLAERHGLPLPIYPVKGYSVSAPLARPEQAPAMGGVDEDRLVAFSRLGDRLRVAATAEFAGFDRGHREADFDTMLRTARELFPEAADWQSAERWAGLRPMTPSSVPVLGRARFTNLWLDTGHGHLGWTTACGSGRLLADLVAGRDPDIDPEGLVHRP